jgi:S1-C subfamily serine protease
MRFASGARRIAGSSVGQANLRVKRWTLGLFVWGALTAGAHAQAIPDLSTLDSESRQSLEMACISARLQGPVAYGHCLNEQLDAMRSAPPVPNLARFNPVTRQSLELACNMAKSRGPASYSRCLHQQLQAMRDAPAIPDVSRFDQATRQALDLACISAKSEGPAAYASCLNGQLDAMRNAPRIPDLTRYDDTTRQALELTCMTAKSQGPAHYSRCLNEQVNTLRASPGIPSLSGLDTQTRQSIELACIGEKSRGPAAYGACVTAQLKSLAVELGETRGAGAAPPAGGVPKAAFPQPRVSDGQTPRTEPPAALPDPSRDASSIVAWSAFPKPPMPAGMRAGSSPADAVFSLVEKSVYVLVSAPSRASLRVRSNVSQGSAVAVSTKLALTNCHVIQGNQVHFLVRGRVVYEVGLAYGDIGSDRCVLQAKSAALTPVQGVRQHTTLAVGERVYTVGSPSGLENTLGEGIISGLRQRGGVDLVQTSAPISPGSSGGGLFDSAGNLIGITTFLVRDSPSLNFAIAADAYWR